MTNRLKAQLCGWVLGLSVSADMAAAKTLHYEPAKVSLSGTILTERRYEPPNYGQSPRTDQRVNIAVLKLDLPVDVAPSAPSSDGLDCGRYHNVRKMELVATGFGALEPYIGKHVAVDGTLFERITAHHYTDVLLTVKAIKAK